jgi:hypothetical protein
MAKLVDSINMICVIIREVQDCNFSITHNLKKSIGIGNSDFIKYKTVRY